MLENSLIILQWIFFAYTSYRIGNKLNIQKSYPWYIIPLWNFWILAKKSEMKVKRTLLVLSLVLILLIISLFLWSYFSIEDADVSTSIFIANRLAPNLIAILIPIIIMVVFAIFWGSVAKKMGKDYWVYVLFSLLSLYIPPLLLAFESIGKFMTSSHLYSLSKEGKEA